MIAALSCFVAIWKKIPLVFQHNHKFHPELLIEKMFEYLGYSIKMIWYNLVVVNYAI